MKPIKIFLGIDPGKKGGIAAINENAEIIFSKASPLIGKEYDQYEYAKTLLEIKNADQVVIVLENIHATHMGGNSSSFTMGRGKGIWEGMITFFMIVTDSIRSKRFMNPTPKTWQKEIWRDSFMTYHVKSGNTKKSIDTKKTSLLACRNFFPGANLLATPRSKKPHDGIVDALLLAEYGRRKFLLEDR